MALFCAVIRRDSFSLLRVHFVSHIQFFSCEISPVCRLMYPYSCFSSHLCFLVIVLFIFMLLVLFLVAVTSLFVLFDVVVEFLY